MTLDLVRSEDLSTWTLEKLASVITEEHEQAEVAAGMAVQHAIRAGEGLLEARGRIFKGARDGAWHEWLVANCPVVVSAATTYMRIAYYAHMLPPNVKSVTDAKYSLSGLPSFASKGHPNQGLPKYVQETARVMRDEGKTFEAIAGALDVSIGTVYRWLTPGYAERHRRQTRESHKKRTKALKLLADQQKSEARVRAAKKAGGSLAESYALTRKLALVLDKAIEESEDREKKAALRRAIALTHQAEYRILEVLGVS